MIRRRSLICNKNWLLLPTGYKKFEAEHTGIRSQWWPITQAVRKRLMKRGRLIAVQIPFHILWWPLLSWSHTGLWLSLEKKEIFNLPYSVMYVPGWKGKYSALSCYMGIKYKPDFWMAKWSLMGCQQLSNGWFFHCWYSYHGIYWNHPVGTTFGYS